MLRVEEPLWLRLPIKGIPTLPQGGNEYFPNRWNRFGEIGFQTYPLPCPKVKQTTGRKIIYMILEENS